MVSYNTLKAYADGKITATPEIKALLLKYEIALEFAEAGIVPDVAISVPGINYNINDEAVDAAELAADTSDVFVTAIATLDFVID